MFRSSSPPGVPPTPEEALACGSRSTRSVLFSITEREAARLTAVVVFPTPPFWLATVRIRATTGPPFPGNTTVYAILYHGGAGGERGKSLARRVRNYRFDLDDLPFPHPPRGTE